MNEKLTSTKPPLPSFRTDEEAAGYFETHSVADVWDRLPSARQTKPSAALEKSIRERRAQAKSAISIRLAPDQIAAAKKLITALARELLNP